MTKIKTLLQLAALAALALAPAAAAKDGDVRATGTCTGASSSKIKLGARDGGIEAELEVDENRNGSTWRVKLKDNSKLAFKGKATTHAPSGSFSIERRIDDLAGSDRVVGIAKNRQSGERCQAGATI